MSALHGTWDLKLKTPIGTLAVTYEFTETAGGLSGTATDEHETVPLTDVSSRAEADGERVTWRQSVTRPMRLNLEFDVVVTGDQLTGHSRAGRLPRTAVPGPRRT
ncbi:hypothetical protein [Saccharopolyspora mangrovi]|uniref:DUF1579 domain-containing protein n=1 Tax=Saccharopolyspora mangrovi TaxID=3082379 RepID=A0ABU6ABJ3_9PSEU|nr:hypothetical protein [Saccharopolyspora sp. S2-29]MEB3368916.1 hypothetical protein [Saccharopolyspora sp. S2-29]